MHTAIRPAATHRLELQKIRKGHAYLSREWITFNGYAALPDTTLAQAISYANFDLGPLAASEILIGPDGELSIEFDPHAVCGVPRHVPTPAVLEQAISLLLSKIAVHGFDILRCTDIC